jgi:hypothetical protein
LVYAKSSIQEEEKEDFFTRKFEEHLKKKLVKFHIWNISLYDAEKWTLGKLDQK